MVGLSGSIWVDGTELHYISETGTERRETGVDNGAVAGLAGSIWIEGTQITYIDSSQHKRMLPYVTLSTVAGLDGSIWLTGELIHYVASGTERFWHTDTHTDSTVPHQDTAHADWTNYSNSHSDYQISHTDTAHSDWTNYSNSYPWSDSNHSDTTFAPGVFVASWHTNYAKSTGGVHLDAWTHANDSSAYWNHTDTYTDSDTHYDGVDTASPPHADTWIYQINSYTNWTNHLDTNTSPHQDTAHADWTNYSNSHADVTNAAHQNTAHSDHTDHSDVAHADKPV